MIPATSSVAATPNTSAIDRRASDASAVRRGRSPGSMMVHPNRSPAAPAMTTDVSSMRPWGASRPSRSGSLPTAAKNPMAAPRLAPFDTRISAVGIHSRIPAAKAKIETPTLLVYTFVANAADGFSV